MWGFLIELFATAFGVTRRGRPTFLPLIFVIALALLAVSFAGGSLAGVVAAVFVFVLAVTASLQVEVARAAVWRAASAPIERGDPPPGYKNDAFDAPTTMSLWRLARAVHEARRGDLRNASLEIGRVDRRRLRPNEERLLDATSALVALGAGDPHRAFPLAEQALPSGSEALDVQLGRSIVSAAWSDAERLRALDRSWAAQGVTAGTSESVPRLRALVRLRIDTSAITSISPTDAQDLASEARAVGDPDLAAELEQQVRPAVYR